MTLIGQVSSLKIQARRSVARLAAIGCVAVLLSGSVAQAALLNLTPDVPDVASSFASVGYNAGTGTFSASGFAFTLDLDGIAPPDHNIDGGSYSLSAVVDNVGNASGTISILGTVPALAMNSGTLLTGTIDAWGFLDGGGEIFEFVFAVTGGDLLPLYPPAGLGGPRGGTIINGVNTGFGGNLGLSFQNDTFSGTSDTFPIPEPASMVSMFLGLAMLVTGQIWRRRRRR